jgi:hypothetical protein
VAASRCARPAINPALASSTAALRADTSEVGLLPWMSPRSSGRGHSKALRVASRRGWASTTCTRAERPARRMGAIPPAEPRWSLSSMVYSPVRRSAPGTKLSYARPPSLIVISCLGGRPPSRCARPGVERRARRMVSALELVKAGVAELGGRGGGRRDFAQGGGPDGPRTEAALAAGGARSYSCETWPGTAHRPAPGRAGRCARGRDRDADACAISDDRFRIEVQKSEVAGTTVARGQTTLIRGRRFSTPPT